MTSPLLLTIQNAHITFGGKPLFEDISFNIHQGDKICLIGKNGTGKTTTMNILSGHHELDGGKRWQLQGSRIGYLEQEVDIKKNCSVFDYIFSGLPAEQQIEDNHYLVEKFAFPLQVNPQNKMSDLSGGQLRRASLAKALINDPDILLLDEPTNHMDFEAVEWLEDYLRHSQHAIVCISHDRTFLRNISNKVFWLDRGNIRICPKGYEYFESWSEALLDQERRELENRERILAYESEWANRGISARRKRNVKRLEDFKREREKLKSDQRLFRQTMQKLELEPISVEMSSKVVAEFVKVSKEFNSEAGKKIILDKFNLRILRGDRIGILGRNGSGKTTLLKMLIGELTPDTGKIKLSRNIEISYFDQKRSNLKPNESLWRNLCPNGDHIQVMGKSKHICGYLKDFLFDPKSAYDVVSTLSGGQKNRLMLAKVLANPGNCLILDEPTNDLDMDTLDMLESILSDYTGTLFIVSHDRDFLDQTVNKIIAFEGDGEVECYVGGYSDYAAAKALAKNSGRKNFADEKISPKNSEQNSEQNSKKNYEQNYAANNLSNNASDHTTSAAETTATPKTTKKLTYKLQFELDNLPEKISALEKELIRLNEKFSAPEFNNLSTPEKNQLLLRATEINNQIEQSEQRWLELEAMRENL